MSSVIPMGEGTTRLTRWAIVPVTAPAEQAAEYHPYSSLKDAEGAKKDIVRVTRRGIGVEKDYRVVRVEMAFVEEEA